MSDRDPPPSLRGRRSECEALDRLVASVRTGQSRALVLCGEAGLGKTALLEYVSNRASGCRIERAAGVESEMELAFAGLQQLCAPMLGRLDRLHGPQRDALATAFGLKAGDPPDRFLVGLAVLTLLSDAAEEQPLVCLVDDAHWLDKASRQILAFVARRLLAESVALVFATRSAVDELDGLPELWVERLSDRDARVLLEATLSAPLDAAVRDAIVAETRGNPLALLELPRGFAPDELAGGFRFLDALPFDARLEEMFRRRVEALPDDAQRLLLVAAAEPTGDPTLLWRAVGKLGIGFEAAGPAAADGLFEVGTRATFRHPVVRSAIYRGASANDRMSAHLALADATDPEVDPDRRAWHRAQATSGPDAEIAEELERSADRARRRGGAAAAAAFLARAAELTRDAHRRGARALAAAEAKFDAGAPDSADQLLAAAAGTPLDDLERARLERLRAQLMAARRRGSDAAPLLLAAARRLEPLDAGLARETYLDALSAALYAGFLAEGGGLRQIAEAARGAPPSPAPTRPMDLLLDGLAVLFTEGYVASLPLLRSVLEAFGEGHSRSSDELRLLGWACRVAIEVGDDASLDLLSARALNLARRKGAVAALPVALTYRALAQVDAGELAAAAQLNQELGSISEAIDVPLFRYASLALAGWRGEESETSELVELSIRDANTRGEGAVIAFAEWSEAVLYNGLGRYERAMVAAKRAVEHSHIALYGWALVELVEAAMRSGEREAAATALEKLSERTGFTGTGWALGIEARSRALLSAGDEAETLYRQAIDHLDSTLVAVHGGRAHLVYGEWLRRAGRRVDGRQHLRTAYEMFTAMGAHGFAERARRELVATGETVRKRTVEALDELTPQEAQIARLACEGRTNPEIGAELFISPRTVEYHLHKVFSKLGVSSRKELRAAAVQAGLPIVSA
jgi:DNA-binding CsgD family transcriptional regulator